MNTSFQDLDSTFREDLSLSFGNISGISPLSVSICDTPFNVFDSDEENIISVPEEVGEDVQVTPPPPSPVVQLVVDGVVEDDNLGSAEPSGWSDNEEEEGEE